MGDCYEALDDLTAALADIGIHDNSLTAELSYASGVALGELMNELQN